MAGEYLTDGDIGFVGLDSRQNPSSLPVGYLSWASNVRLERGVARTRKGVEKFFNTQVVGPDIKVVGSGYYTNSSGQEIIIVISHDYAANETFLFEFDPSTGGFGAPKNITTATAGEVIDSPDGVSVVSALGKVFISRGFLKRPIMWDMANTFTVLPNGSGSGHQFPNCKSLIYFQNRLVALGANHTLTPPSPEQRYTVSVGHFLEWDKWPSVDAFAINQGGNDETVALVPWTMNEFVVLMRSSSFYLNVGTSRYISGQPLSNDSNLFTLANDIGCCAERTAIQVAEGVMFLSDKGVYFLRPNPSGNDGVKLLTLGEPISATIDDVIQRINGEFVSQACAAYWNNRYYLAIPIDDSEVNNCVLVYNFILKAWESVDFYSEGVDFQNFVVAKREKQRRLFAIDSNEGLLMLEEFDGDQVGPPTGTPMLNFLETIGEFAGQTGFRLDGSENCRLTIGGVPITPVRGTITTRRYTFKDSSNKRFSSVETDMDVPSGGNIVTDAITNNPDTTTPVDILQFTGSEDTTRRVPVRKIAFGLQVKYTTLNSIPAIRSTYVRASALGKTNQTKS